MEARYQVTYTFCITRGQQLRLYNVLLFVEFTVLYSGRCDLKSGICS